MKKLALLMLLTSCVTTPKEDIAVVKGIIECDNDPDFGAEWCVLYLDDGRVAGIPSWEISVGDAVRCEERGSLTCFKINE